MSSYEVDDNKFPYQTVVFIQSKFQGAEEWTTGSGTIVGRNDILTASHCVYDERYGGWATETRIYASKNTYYSDPSSYYTFKWGSTYNWDENGDGLLSLGDNNFNTLFEVENDIALLSLTTDIASIYGAMGLKFDFMGGRAYKLGYSGNYNYNLYYDDGVIYKDSRDNYFWFHTDDIETHGGDSGGPLYINSGGSDGYQIIGVVSGKNFESGTGSACALNAHATWLLDEIDSNNYLYDKSFATITSASSVDEGSKISFTFKTHKSEENMQYTYTLSEASSSDFSSNELSGTTIIDVNGEASFTISISADQKTEGTEHFILSIGEKTKSISINDTSIDESKPKISGPSGSAGDSTSSKSINENSTPVHAFSANETVTWSLTGGKDASKFSINSSTGALIFKLAPDYESPTDDDSNNDYIVVVRATDSGNNTADQTVTISVLNIDEFVATISGTSSIDSLQSTSKNDSIDGGEGTDTLSYTGSFSNYSFTRGTGTIQITDQRNTGTTDGKDTLKNIEYLQFSDVRVPIEDVQGKSQLKMVSGQTEELTIIRDYDGNIHGYLDNTPAEVITGYKYQGKLDVNNDGITEAIFTNKESGRWVTASLDPITGTTDYSKHGQGGTTRIVGIYEDPLVKAGLVEKNSDLDGSRAFINDLKLDNLILKTVGDYDSDGFQEVYWSKVDNTAYLRAVMHIDGNIQYANYQNLDQMTNYLTSNGFEDTVALIT